MKRFAGLYALLDETSKTSEKVAHLEDYFRNAPPGDIAWAVYFLLGRKPRQVVNSRRLAGWAAEESGFPQWLFEESYEAVGDLAETIALILPESDGESTGTLQHWVENELLTLSQMDEESQKAQMASAWGRLNAGERLVWNKLITGGFRVGVSQRLVTKALAGVSGIPDAVIAHRLMGKWEPCELFTRLLFSPDTCDTDSSRPYPFFLAYPLECPPESLGRISDWQAEWKWDGIRAQVISRGGVVFIWSRGEELVTDRFPEISDAASSLPEGTVLDGEILAWDESGVLPFARLQKRIGRKNLTRKILQEAPAILVAYDLLELGGQDFRSHPLIYRRQKLEELGRVPGLGAIRISEVIRAESWEALAKARMKSRETGVEGLMLKRLASPYRAGRHKGDWWKWKIDPYTVDAVLVYAQAGHGRRASLYTDYTFAVWSDGALVPFAKAYSGLTDEEIRKVDQFIRRNTLEKFGPVRVVKPELVFELAFEGISLSRRHKSGVAVRFPRIQRWRTDKPASEADTLEAVKALIPRGQEG